MWVTEIRKSRFIEELIALKHNPGGGRFKRDLSRGGDDMTGRLYGVFYIKIS